MAIDALYIDLVGTLFAEKFLFRLELAHQIAKQAKESLHTMSDFTSTSLFYGFNDDVFSSVSSSFKSSSRFRKLRRINVEKLLCDAHSYALLGAKPHQDVSLLLDSRRPFFTFGLASEDSMRQAFAKNELKEPQGVYGGVTDLCSKIRHAMYDANTTRARSCLITSSRGGILAGYELGIPTVGVSFGVHEKRHLEATRIKDPYGEIRLPSTYRGTIDSLREFDLLLK